MDHSHPGLQRLTAESVDKMLAKIDTDNSGTIDRVEFRQYIFNEDDHFQGLITDLAKAVAALPPKEEEEAKGEEGEKKEE